MRNIKKQQQVSATFLTYLKNGEEEQAHVLINTRKNQVDVHWIEQQLREDVQAGNSVVFHTLLKIPSQYVREAFLPVHKLAALLTLACETGQVSLFSPSVSDFFLKRQERRDLAEAWLKQLMVTSLEYGHRDVFCYLADLLEMKRPNQIMTDKIPIARRIIPKEVSCPMGASIALEDKASYERCLSLFGQGKIHAPLFLSIGFDFIKDKDFIFLPQSKEMVAKSIHGEMAKQGNDWTNPTRMIEHMSSLWPDVTNDLCLQLIHKKEYKKAQHLLPYCHGHAFLSPDLSEMTLKALKKFNLPVLVSFIEKAMIEQSLENTPKTSSLRRKM